MYIKVSRFYRNNNNSNNNRRSTYFINSYIIS